MRSILSFIIAIVAVSAMVSCRTNQANMSDAYQKAIAARDSDNLGLDSTIYSKTRREMKHSTMQVGGADVDVSTQWVTVTKDGGDIRENLKAFNVVVGQFKQVFNAKSMRERLVDNGYPGAFVVNTSEPYYFVIAGSFASPQEAIDLLERTKKDTSLKMKAPLPFILQPAQHSRN